MMTQRGPWIQRRPSRGATFLLRSDCIVPKVSITYPIATYGTIGVVGLWLVTHLLIKAWRAQSKLPGEERYRRAKFASTIAFILAVVAAALFWARLLQHKGTFFGLLGAGLAVALREPLLALAGRIAIFAGHMYNVGDRIEISKMSGDVIDVGLFYTRMMEVGNWIHADQATGRILQFSNSIIFANPIFNYTQNFNYLWDEIMLPVKYASDLDSAKELMLRAADEYTETFLHGAEEELEKLGNSFVVPKFDLKPAVFTDVTDNYVRLNLRYIVDPRKRRIAKSFLWDRILPEVRANEGIQLGSSTMDLSVKMERDADEVEKKDHGPRLAA